MNIGFITLHVGLGTFRPMSVDVVEDHVMHEEYYSLSQETADLINETKGRGNKVLCGTNQLQNAGDSGE